MSKPPKFSKRHYIIISETISKLDFLTNYKYHVAIRFAQLFLKDNPKFNPQCFMRAVFKTAKNPKQKGGE